MPTDDTAHAANWRTVLMVDLLLAAAVTAVGLVVLFAASPVFGALLVACRPRPAQVSSPLRPAVVSNPSRRWSLKNEQAP